MSLWSSCKNLIPTVTATSCLDCSSRRLYTAQDASQVRARNRKPLIKRLRPRSGAGRVRMAGTPGVPGCREKAPAVIKRQPAAPVPKIPWGLLKSQHSSDSNVHQRRWKSGRPCCACNTCFCVDTAEGQPEKCTRKFFTS